MKTKILILIVFTSLILESCATQFMTSGLAPQTIKEATIINPASSIEFIRKGKGNRSSYSDSLTQIANRNVEIGLKEYLTNYFDTHLIELDAATNDLVHFQLYQMMNMIEMKKKIERVAIPPSIDSVMQTNSISYAVCAIHIGFSRETGNYGTQIVKGVLLGLITFGSVYTVPVKSVSDLTVCIIDREKHNIAFYNRSYLQDIEPIEKSVTDNQIRKLFEKYFTHHI